MNLLEDLEFTEIHGALAIDGQKLSSCMSVVCVLVTNVHASDAVPVAHLLGCVAL